ncbi:MAG: hypothetical protein M1835_002512 [Candelina submexicana]|nr:MAG: hypothetical protein M1835_002512 [Candelina submexicana]
MASGNYEPPDLASVLRTLATYAPPKPSQTAAFAPIAGTQHEEELEEGEYEPPDIPHQASQQPVQIAPPAQFIHPSNQPRPVSPHLNGDYGLVYSSQMRYENNRPKRGHHSKDPQGSEPPSSYLKVEIRSVGGKVPASTPVTSPQEDAAELARYEKKVHRAAREMVDASTKDLKTMGIPFFGTKQDLIREAPDEEANIGLQYPDNKRRAESAISSDELLNLQRRMLETLEDLSRG